MGAIKPKDLTKMRNNCKATHSSFFQDILCKDYVTFYKLTLKCILWFCIFPLFFSTRNWFSFGSLMHSGNQLGWSILLIKWFCTTQNPNYEYHLFVLYILVFFCLFSFGHCIVCPSSIDGFWWFMMFNASFNNISVISWQSVLLME